ncbi:MAG: hypothetical protein Q4P24_07070, partial [Rhodobacterales bacterium]|nr:hypothetical protein [Rhodobacterales bacterium]
PQANYHVNGEPTEPPPKNLPGRLHGAPFFGTENRIYGEARLHQGHFVSLNAVYGCRTGSWDEAAGFIANEPAGIFIERNTVKSFVSDADFPAVQPSANIKRVLQGNEEEI